MSYTELLKEMSEVLKKTKELVAGSSVEQLKKVAKRIVDEVPNISQVFYDTTNKPPGTIEWE